MKKITQATERLVASYQIASPLGAYAKRADRIKKTAANEVYERLADREIVPGDASVYASLDWEDKMTARGLRLGVEEFKKNHPQYADELEGTIKHQRECRRTYVEFGLNSEMPDNVYLGILEEIGIPSNIVRSTLSTIKRVSDYFGDLGDAKILVD